MGTKDNSNVTSLKGGRIGPWMLGETLGVGSTGKVLMAQNVQTGQIAAVKIISKSIFNAQGSTFVGSNDPDVLPYGIEREITIMKLLNHPNVLRLYDVWETSTDLYMVLEYVEKGELFNLLIERGPLPENEAVRFFRQIIIGISYCHALGIVHRDLKPENLLLDHKFNIKLADFGMAALESKDKLLETSCGSPHYAAPEIVSGLPYHGFESDVWSCGVILYALLTGRLPFDEDDGNIRKLLLKVQSGEFEMPDKDEISIEAQDLIAKILTVDPSGRIKTREILKHPLLKKYPSIKDSKSIRNLPREDTYLNPLDHNDGTVDRTILKNLVVLWHGRDENEIVMKLNEQGPNLEKTFYALLHRFKYENEQQQLKQQQIAKRISSASSSPQRNIVKSSSRRSINQILVTPKKKRSSGINVSSAHKRPVSIQKWGEIGGGNNGLISPSKKRSLSNRKLSAILNTPSSSPSRKRMSIAQDAPPMPTSVLRDYNKRASRNSKRFSFLPSIKRQSITSKIIATYAKLSEDNDWEYIDKEAKRTSSDFATLIDNIFEHEKYEQIRREKEGLERKVREAKAREARERKEREERKQREEREREERRALERKEQEAREREEMEDEEQLRLEEDEQEILRQEELQRSLEDEVAKLRAELEETRVEQQLNSMSKNQVARRSVSEPHKRHSSTSKRDSLLALQYSINTVLNKRAVSVQTRPISRLDPGIMAQEVAHELDYDDEEILSERTLRREKTILETIRRSNFLGSQFDIHKELKNAKKEKIEKAKKRKQLNRKLPDRISYHDQRFVSDGTTITSAHDGYDTTSLTRHTTVGVLRDDESEPKKLSEVRIPEVTRRSRHLSASSKRFSVLSMYSTMTSYTNLADFMKSDVQLKPLNDTASSKVTQQPEFMFESTIDNVERISSNDNSHISSMEAPNNTVIKLNYADRFYKPVEVIELDDTDNTQPDTEEDITKVKLPALPPLEKLNKSPNGLGIYQHSSPREDFKHAVRSVTPNENKENEDPAGTTQQKAPLTSVGKELGIREPLTDLAQQGVPKKRPSFFRKFSKEKIKPEYDYQLDTTVNNTKMFRALDKLLNGWTSYGLKQVRSSPSVSMITGKLSSDNILSLRSTAFQVVVAGSNHGSSVRFTKKSGSKKTFARLVNEIEKILEKEKVLISTN
ncbi:protein kinase GIN4 Ecym_1058 [Eremothecium cymbalariae DBVPG|uniref:non-specific serine/threonine protein kinase n=1 Tax=Eremothecium cymbalariae (strain CBS 270.75 / DBVPG 7215 / KCTC 17166 / NRRL Y-17582) TaxID=931890 RepID=G8JMA7_ERECY|nr:hypothetical protein Ecym_1058 [Eremothecium cymbalariae DBVPG\